MASSWDDLRCAYELHSALCTHRLWWPELEDKELQSKIMIAILEEEGLAFKKVWGNKSLLKGPSKAKKPKYSDMYEENIEVIKTVMTRFGITLDMHGNVEGDYVEEELQEVDEESDEADEESQEADEESQEADEESQEADEELQEANEEPQEVDKEPQEANKEPQEAEKGSRKRKETPRSEKPRPKLNDTRPKRAPVRPSPPLKVVEPVDHFTVPFTGQIPKRLPWIMQLKDGHPFLLNVLEKLQATDPHTDFWGDERLEQFLPGIYFRSKSQEEENIMLNAVYQFHNLHKTSLTFWIGEVLFVAWNILYYGGNQVGTEEIAKWMQGGLPDFLCEDDYKEDWNKLLAIRNSYANKSLQSLPLVQYNATQARQTRLPLRGKTGDRTANKWLIKHEGKEIAVDIEGHYQPKNGYLLATAKSINPSFPDARTGFVINAARDYPYAFKKYCNSGTDFTITMGNHSHLENVMGLDELEVNAIFRVPWGKSQARQYLLAAPKSSNRDFLLFPHTALRDWPSWASADFELAKNRALWMGGIGMEQDMRHRKDAMFYGMRKLNGGGLGKYNEDDKKDVTL